MILIIIIGCDDDNDDNKNDGDAFHNILWWLLFTLYLLYVTAIAVYIRQWLTKLRDE